MVHHRLHKAWHVLFSNFTAHAICERFWDFYNTFACDETKTEWERKRDREWINLDKSRIKQKAAWGVLFGKIKCLEDMVTAVNDVWIDPGYKLLITVEQIKTIGIARKRK